jgi:hypothetical protein
MQPSMKAPRSSSSGRVANEYTTRNHLVLLKSIRHQVIFQCVMSVRHQVIWSHIQTCASG